MKVCVHWTSYGEWTQDEYYVTEIIRPDLLRVDSRRAEEPYFAIWNPETERWEGKD